MDLILRHAQLPDTELITDQALANTIVDIGIEGDTITAIAPYLSASAQKEVDVAGNLVLPAFVNGQLHACKSFWRRPLATLSPDIATLPRFEAAHHVKAHYTVADVVARVDETMQLAIQHGTCAIRLFADVDAASGLTAMEGLLHIRERYQPWMTVQVVAFPQDGFTSVQTTNLMRSALEMGADIVGGIPWIEADKNAQAQHVAACFALAQDFDRDLHFVCDDAIDPNLRSLALVAETTEATGWQGRVAATQCAALAAYPDAEATALIQQLKQANITIFSNSHVSLIATEFPNQQPWPRGITRVRELLDAGVTVAAGQDDIDNWFYPFGRNDMLEVAQYMAHNGQFAWGGEVNRVLPLVTTAPAKCLGLQRYGLAVGCEANLIVLNAPDWHSALQFQADKRHVILRGSVVAETKRHTQFHLQASD